MTVRILSFCFDGKISSNRLENSRCSLRKKNEINKTEAKPIPILPTTGEGYWMYRLTWSWEGGSIPHIVWLSGKELSLIRMTN